MTNGEVNVFIPKKEILKYENLGYYPGVTKLTFNK